MIYLDCGTGPAELGVAECDVVVVDAPVAEVDAQGHGLFGLAANLQAKQAVPVGVAFDAEKI